MRKNLLIALLVLTVAVSFCINYAEAISPKLQEFLEGLESRVSQLEQFNTYQKTSSPLLILQNGGVAQETFSCDNNDPILNASWEGTGVNNNFRKWKISGDTLEYFVQNNYGDNVSLTIFLTCRG